MRMAFERKICNIQQSPKATPLFYILYYSNSCEIAFECD